MQLSLPVCPAPTPSTHDCVAAKLACVALADHDWVVPVVMVTVTPFYFGRLRLAVSAAAP